MVDRFCRIKSGIRRCDKVLSRVLNAHTHTPKKEKKFQMKIESVIFSDSLNTHFHILNWFGSTVFLFSFTSFPLLMIFPFSNCFRSFSSSIFRFASFQIIFVDSGYNLMVYVCLIFRFLCLGFLINSTFSDYIWSMPHHIEQWAYKFPLLNSHTRFVVSRATAIAWPNNLLSVKKLLPRFNFFVPFCGTQINDIWVLLFICCANFIEMKKKKKIK